jgi:flagellar operon protein
LVWTTHRGLSKKWMIYMSDCIPSITGISHSRTVQQAGRKDAPDGEFGDLFQRTLDKTAQTAEGSGIAFSKHAMARAEERGIELDDTLMDQLSSSVERAQAKGATNILAFDATRAFIINVPRGRVITTMSQQEMEENIFTNIDGAVLLR